MQVPTLKAPGIKLLKLKYDKLLSNFAFNFNWRRHVKDWDSFRRHGKPSAEVAGLSRYTLNHKPKSWTLNHKPAMSSNAL